MSSAENAWTSFENLRARLLKEWDSGRLLRALLTADFFPFRLAIKGPSTGDMTTRFDDVRRWIAALKAHEKSSDEKRGYRLEWSEFTHRQLGKNTVPVAAWFDAEDDALDFLGKRREAKLLRALVQTLEASHPPLRSWAEEHPRLVLDYAEEWPALLSVISWVQAHPRPGVYTRQIDAPGVHTKFIETHRAVLSSLLDRVLPSPADASASGAAGFEKRYGFLNKPRLTRLRFLDPSLYLEGLSDLGVPIEDFIRLNPRVERVFMTENEINFLAFPRAPRSLVVFGAGYGFADWEKAPWLATAQLYYWGDIDTHGFAILDQLRAHFPTARSFLMDKETLLEHREYWTSEASPVKRDLTRLNPEEGALYDDLRLDRLARGLRFEQEKVAFAKVETVVEEISR